MKLLYFAASYALLSGALPTGDEAAQRDMAKLQGRWLYVHSQRNGKQSDVYKLIYNQLEFKGNQMIQVVDFPNRGLVPIPHVVKLSTKENPRVIDFARLEGNFRGRWWEGIYSLEGDTLKLCITLLPGIKDRPLDFTAPAESNRWTMEFKRATD